MSWGVVAAAAAAEAAAAAAWRSESEKVQPGGVCEGCWWVWAWVWVRGGVDA